MANLINDYLSMPLWLSIPLCVVYLALLAYFVYILWRYRGKSNLVTSHEQEGQVPVSPRNPPWWFTK